jgi:biotin operon repressor
LKGLGGFTDQQCGLHVHVDGEGLDTATLVNIVRRYAAHEDIIDSWINEDRRKDRNSYTHTCKGLEHNLSTLTRPREVASSHTRYYKVNLQAFLRHGTVEFRQHHGTLDDTQICNWIQFCVQFVENSDAMLREVVIPGDGSLRKNAIERKFFAMIEAFTSGSDYWTSVEKLSQIIGCSVESVPVYVSKFRAWMGEDACIFTGRNRGYRLNYSYKGDMLARLNHPSCDRRITEIEFTEPGLFHGLAQEVQDHFAARVEAYRSAELARMQVSLPDRMAAAADAWAA